MNTNPDALVRTGVAGLDEILLGGVVRKNNILVEGGPGAGKTTLGLEFIYSGVSTFNEPGLIISFELSPDKLLRDAKGFNWDFERYIEHNTVKIIETTPAVLLSELRNTDSVLAHEVAAVGAKRLMIDGLTPLQIYADSHDIPFRESIHLVIDGLTRLGVTTLMTRESVGRLGSVHERYVFDTIISLGHHNAGRPGRRSISVVKSRGQDFVPGVHTLQIRAGEGLRVYPRAQSSLGAQGAQPSTLERVSTGSADLDVLMDGGLYRGSITMVSGISGTGKTVVGTQFLANGAKQGKRGLLVSLDEQPEQLIRNAETLGFNLPRLIQNGQVFIHYESPLELELDVHFQNITRLVEESKIDFVVCDSVAVYEATGGDEANDFLYALASFFKNRLITAYFNYESPELLGVSQISQNLKGCSHLVDNIILLSHVEISTHLRRAIVVPKVRGSRNKPVTHEFEIGQGGLKIIVDDESDSPIRVPQLPFSSYYGLLARSPSRRAPAIDEAVQSGDNLAEVDSERDV